MKYATVKRRFLAVLLDLIILISILALISVLFRETKVNLDIKILFEKIKTMDAPFAYFVSMLYDISTSAGLIVGILQLAFVIIYWIVLPIVWPRQTIGRAIFYVKLVRLNGEPLSFGTLIIRELLAKIILFIFTFGLIAFVNLYMVLRSNGRRAIHDRMANTLVVSTLEEEKCN